MASLRTYRTSAQLLSLLAIAACTGELGLSKGEPNEGNPPPGGNVNGSGNGQNGGSQPGDQSVDPVTGTPLEMRPLVVSRLNRTEYNNTVRDLLGTELSPADAFPSDGLAGGFETVGSALSLSPTYVTSYERAAHDLISELFSPGHEEQRAAIVHCDVQDGGEDCARAIVSDFARRAWRRPITDAEVDSVLNPFHVAAQVGAPSIEGLKYSLAAVLMSPYFIFKLELDEDPSSNSARRLNPYELATRLSYTLWSTMPDDQLMAAAEAGTLTTDEELSAQIDRMLADPRSQAILESFAARWLEFYRLEIHEVEPSLFPEYSPALARSMKTEAFRFLEEFLHSPRPAAEMLTAGFTYIDQRLADHYELPFPGDDPNEFVRIDTTGSQRAGLLTLGALLTTTSFSSRTSPVRRGEFVFSHLLCGYIPPPPPEVEGIPIDEADGLTLRERLERHRDDPDCAQCHMIMDPLGFGFENYDAIGRYRTHDGPSPVDATGELPDGTTFEGAVELSELLGADPRLSNCATKKFMIYAGKRLLSGRNDDGWVNYIYSQADEEDGGSLGSIVRFTLMSEPFRSRVPSGS